MTFDEWVKLGVEKGWVGPILCSTHDGIPLTEDEDNDFDEGDPCIWIMRAYEDPRHKAQVEAYHSPSVWRKT